jgi:hypothetical protein
MIDPADLWCRHQQQWLRYANNDNEIEVIKLNATKKFNQFCNETSLSADSKDYLLKVIHDIHNMSNSESELMLPKSRRTISAILEKTEFSTHDIEYHVFKFSSDRMLQLSQSATMVYGYIPLYLQSILLDRRNPPESFYFNTKRCHNNRIFYDENGIKLTSGPEFMQGTAWDRCNENVPDDGVVLTIIISSDGTITQSGTRIPVRVSIGNQAVHSRMQEGGSRTVGLLPVISSRTPKGTGLSEKLSRSQKQSKTQIKASSLAHMLVHLEEKAKQPVEFLIQEKTEDGTINEVRIEVYLRIILHVVDKKEEVDLLGLNQTQCPRCYGMEKLRELNTNKGIPDSQGLAYMSTLPEFGCASTQYRRTVVDTLNHKIKSSQISMKKGGIGASAKFDRDHGINSGVEEQLLRLKTLYPGPQGAFACFATDMLHVWGLGIAPKVSRCIESYIFMTMKTTKHFKSREDLRHLIDLRVSGISASNNWVHFNEGWFETELGSISSTEGDAIFCQLLFVYIGATELIPNETDRRRLLNMHHNELGDENIPGNGINIPKYHDWLSCVRTLKEFGSLRNANTSPYETLMKGTKELDRRTKRSRGDDHCLDLFHQISVTELNRGLTATSSSSGSSTTQYTTKYRGKGFSLTSVIWQELKNNLFAKTEQSRTCNMKGPPLHETWVDVIDSKLEYIYTNSDGIFRFCYLHRL